MQEVHHEIKANGTAGGMDTKRSWVVYEYNLDRIIDAFLWIRGENEKWDIDTQNF